MSNSFKKEMELIRYVRSNILKITAGLTTVQLNKIPCKFNNSIAWNLGHLVITQQNMGYKLGGLNPVPGTGWFAEFSSGTTPVRDLSSDNIDMIKHALVTTIERFENDYKNGVFDRYKPWTLHGVMDVSGVEDAAKIICVHEGRHYGVISCLLKLVA